MRAAILMALLSCKGEAPPEPEPVVAAAPEAPEPPQLPWHVQEHMHEHLSAATSALYHVIRGDLDQARAEGASLAGHKPPEDIPGSWTPHILGLNQAAVVLSKAPDLDQAAVAVVGLAAVCAGCHVENKVEPKGPPPSVLASVHEEASAMQRHEWATYLMWLGLVAPSADLFGAGTEALAHDKAKLPELDAQVEALEHRVHDIAAKGAKAEDDAARGAAFAELIGTCSSCHLALEVPFD